MSALYLYLLADSLLIGDLWYGQCNVNAELALQLSCCNFKMLLAETAEYLLLCAIVLSVCESRILLDKTLDACGDLGFVALSLCLYCH